jgi:hypothetical protein
MSLRRILKNLFGRAPIAPPLADASVWYEGGDGLSPLDPVIVRGANYDMEGTWAEFAWLIQRYGQKDVDWRLVSHSTGSLGDRHIDTIVLQRPHDQELTHYFDVTESFGHWQHPELR